MCPLYYKGMHINNHYIRPAKAYYREGLGCGRPDLAVRVYLRSRGDRKSPRALYFVRDNIGSLACVFIFYFAPLRT